MGAHKSKSSVFIYLPATLHRWLKAKAAVEGTSISAQTEEAIRIAYKRETVFSEALPAREAEAEYKARPKKRRKNDGRG